MTYCLELSYALAGLSEFSTHPAPVVSTPEGWTPPGPSTLDSKLRPADPAYANRTYVTERTERLAVLLGQK